MEGSVSPNFERDCQENEVRYCKNSFVLAAYPEIQHVSRVPIQAEESPSVALIAKCKVGIMNARGK